MSSSNLKSYIPANQQRLHYERLAPRQQQVYRLLLDACLERKATVPLPFPLTSAELFDIADAVVDDVPELLKVPRFSCAVDAKRQTREARLGYRVAAIEHERQLMVLESLSREVVHAVSAMGTEASRARYVHDWIVKHCLYLNSGNDQEHTAYGAIAKRRAVCEGFAFAFKYLCDRCGVKAAVVAGHSGERLELLSKKQWRALKVNHSWNLVCVEGTWYHVDTSNDVCLTHSVGRYDYFLVGDNTISADHKVSPRQPLPPCPRDFGVYERMGRFAETEQDLRKVFRRKLRKNVPLAVHLGGCGAKAWTLANRATTIAFEEARLLWPSDGPHTASKTYNRDSHVLELTLT